MDIRWTGEGRRLHISLHGELDHHAAKEALHTLNTLLDDRLPLDCKLDLSGLTFMDSSGIAVILGVYKRIFELAGEMCVENVPKQASRVIQAAGIDRIVTILPSAM